MIPFIQTNVLTFFSDSDTSKHSSIVEQMNHDD